jgi:hypothetical protein
MFRLLRIWDAERELRPGDFQYILTPCEAFSQARIFYDLSSDRYHYPDSVSCHDVPRRKPGNVSSFSAPDQRRRAGYADDVYDNTQRNIDMGWIIGIDTSGQWDYYRNPFYFDENSNLIYDCFMDHYHEWFEMEVRGAYEKCLNNHHGKKPAPTIKQAYYSDAPVQHAQAAKTLNSKGVGRLLAAGGIYNGNPDGFRQTAEQLGGEAPAGYDQMLNETTQGVAIAVASVAAGLGIGRLNTLSQIAEANTTLHFLGEVKGDYSAIHPGPLDNVLADTFTGGAYKEILLSGDTSFFRAGIEGQPFGQFMGFEKPRGVIQTRIDKAILPVWPNGATSPLDTRYEIRIPAGNTVYVGETGYQSGFYQGGTGQVVVIEPWAIPGIKVFNAGRLK